MKLYMIIQGKIMLILLGLFLFIGNAHSQKGERNPAFMMKTPSPILNNGSNFTIVQGTDNLGCYYDVTVTPTWSVSAPTGASCNQNLLPHGFVIEVTGTTIISAAYNPNSLWASTPLPVFSSGSIPMTYDYVYWVKDAIGDCWSTGTNTHTIPSGQTQKVRVRVNLSTATVKVYVRELNGGAWSSGGTWVPPAPLGWGTNLFWNFAWDTTFINSCNYSIGQNIDMCQGTSTTFTLIGTPTPATSTVTWYKSPLPCPSTPPPGSTWVPDQTGGLSYNTNAINASTCYVAMIKKGCTTCFTNTKTVTICPGKPSAVISHTVAAGYSPLQTINGENHACVQWGARLSIPALSSYPCNTTIVKWERSVNGNPWQVAGGSVEFINITIGNTTTLCTQKYEYRVLLSNACGSSYAYFSVFLDHLPDPGTIKTATAQMYDIGIGTQNAPIICYGTGTRLVHTTTCGKIQYWEYRDENTPCSGSYPATWTNAGAGGTSGWWTNPLFKTRQYRAIVKNGACAGVTSPIITVKVIPELTVSINTTSPLLCANPVLTAITSYGAPCSYTNLLSYQWYTNGAPIAATQATFSPLKQGHYSVVVTSLCGTAKPIAPITICKPFLAITGPCCVCMAPYQPDNITLTAVVTYSPGACGPTPIYKWYKNGVLLPLEVNPTLNVTTPGSYKVVVSFPGAPGCTLQDQKNITQCQ